MENKPMPIEFKKQRILTTKQLSEIYECGETQITQNFNNHIDKFTLGKHYYLLQGEELREFKRNIDNIDVAANVNKLYLWTERGANRHCKILDTDKAWEQFDDLEETYFKINRQTNIPPQIDSKFLFQIAGQLEEKEKQIQVMAPKAEYFDALVDRKLLINIRDTAKEIKIKEGIFVDWLLKKYAYRDTKRKLKPYADYVPELFEIKEFTKGAFSDKQTLITPKGRETFRLLLIQEGLIKEAV